MTTIENVYEDGDSSYFTNSRSGYRFRVDYDFDGPTKVYRVIRYDIPVEQPWGHIEAERLTLLAYASTLPNAEPREVQNIREGLEWITNDRA